VKKNVKILILDDTIDDAKRISGFLKDNGHEHPIVFCDSKSSYLSKLDDFSPDVVISEHTIPGYSSFNALDDARNKIPNVIFILVSGNIPEEFAVELLKEGVDDYVLKNHLLRLPHAIESAMIKRQYAEETKKLAEMNNELIQANSEIDAKNQSMTQSIVFAERIQSLILPKLEVLLKDFREAFILYKPKDIVSGDFYWFNKNDDKFMVAAADCTGHGVPGALLSIIGINFLNEIAEDKNNFVYPSDVLSLLDLNMRTMLRQNETPSYQDGIDIAFVTIDKSRKKLYYSGCKRPLLIFRRRDKKLVEYKGEPYYIGGIDPKVKKTFRTQEIPYRVGDVIYMFSDGVPDQFGGENNKKLMKKEFLNILMSFNHLSLTYQGELLEQKLKKWQGDFEQTDDILVIGIKL